MQLKDALENKEFDVRIRDRLMAEGKVSHEDFKKFLETLPDEEGNYVILNNPAE